MLPRQTTLFFSMFASWAPVASTEDCAAASSCFPLCFLDLALQDLDLFGARGDFLLQGLLLPNELLVGRRQSVVSFIIVSSTKRNWKASV